MSGIFRIFVGGFPPYKNSFCHVRKLSYLCTMTKNNNIYLKTNTTELTLFRLRKIATYVLLYCVGKMGTHKYKPVPKVSIINNADDKFYGVFECGKNTIVINRAYCSNVKLFIQTLLHEYTHYLQNMTTYIQLYKKVGYEKHPYEIESRNSEKLYSEAFKQLKPLL